MKFEPRKFVKLPCFMMLVAAGFLAGCQSVKEVLELDTSAELHIAASEDINPDADRRPSPVVLHIFKLTDDRQFRRQDFLSLYENAEARLGKELVGSVVLKEVTPGEKRTEVIELSPDVRFLGVMAEFNRYQDAESLLILPVLEHNVNGYNIEIDATTVHRKVEEVDESTEVRPNFAKDKSRHD